MSKAMKSRLYFAIKLRTVKSITRAIAGLLLVKRAKDLAVAVNDEARLEFVR